MDARALADVFTDRMGHLQIALDSLLSNVQQGGIERDANEEKLTQLYQAIENGDFDQVSQLGQEEAARAFINRRLGVRQVGFNTHHMQITPLGVCCLQNKAHMAQVLIDGGADVNMTYGSLNATALMTSAHLGNADMVDVILAAGGDPSARDSQGCNSLTYAATGKCSFKVMKRLIESHVELNCKNPFGFTALHVTCGMGMEEAVSMLLSAGADPNIATDFGHTPLHLAVTGKKERIHQINKVGFQESLEEPVVQDIAEHGLQEWAKIRQLDLGVNLPKRKSMSPNAKIGLRSKDNANRNSEIFYGSEDDDEYETNAVPTRRKLSSSAPTKDGKQRISDARPQSRPSGSSTSLFSCASGRSRRRSRSDDSKNKEKRRSIVLESDTHTVNNSNNKETTHQLSTEAAELSKKYTNVVRLLLASSCDVNTVDTYNWTALDYAVLSEDEELKFVLVKAGGDPLRAVKQFALTDLYFAIKAENKKDIKALLRDSFDLNSSFHHEMVHALDDSEDEQDTSSGSVENVDVGLTPLTLCARVDNNELVKLMLKSGAKANQASKNGEFPLAEAAINGNMKVAEILLKGGADINMQTTAYNGACALMLAIRHKHRKIVEMLVKRGAKVECVNTDGKSAFSLAVDIGDQRVVELLRSHTTSHIGKDLASLKQWYDKQCPKNDPYAGLWNDEPVVVPRSSSHMFMRTNFYPKAQRPHSVIEPMVSDLLKSRINNLEGIMIPDKPRERTRSCDLTIPVEKTNNLNRRNFSKSGDVDASDDFIRTSQPDIVKTTVPSPKSVTLLSPTDVFSGDMSVIQEVSFEYEMDTQSRNKESKTRETHRADCNVRNTNCPNNERTLSVSITGSCEALENVSTYEPEHATLPHGQCLVLPPPKTDTKTQSTTSTLESPDRTQSPEMPSRGQHYEQCAPKAEDQNESPDHETAQSAHAIGHFHHEPKAQNPNEQNSSEMNVSVDQSPQKEGDDEGDSSLNDQSMDDIHRISPFVAVSHVVGEDGQEKPTFASLEDFLHSGVVPEYDGSTYDRTFQRKSSYGEAVDEDEANHGDDEESATDWTAYDSDFIPDNPIISAEEFTVLMKNKDNDRKTMQASDAPPRQSGIETTV